MTDDPILDVIRSANPSPFAPRTFLAALRDAGYDIVPTDTARLGQAVRTITEQPDTIVGTGPLGRIWAEAGVERP